ncbi:MAG TPA: hypothetical protein VFH44_00325 [Solirubrobacterales bacterium]|nr:hypothetical protein [Solirubrobacterales bacterium]
MDARRLRGRLAVAGVSIGLAFGVGGCGDDDSAAASVGACIDADNVVVDCGSSEATKRLVSDQSEPDAIACVEIGDKPQTEVEVDGTTFCAEDL